MQNKDIASLFQQLLNLNNNLNNNQAILKTVIATLLTVQKNQSILKYMKKPENDEKTHTANDFFVYVAFEESVANAFCAYPRIPWASMSRPSNFGAFSLRNSPTTHKKSRKYLQRLLMSWLAVATAADKQAMCAALFIVYEITKKARAQKLARAPHFCLNGETPSDCRSRPSIF